MDPAIRMRQIRLLDKMIECPEISSKLGLKDKSCFKEGEILRKGDRVQG